MALIPLNFEAPQFLNSDMTYCVQQNLEAELLGDFLQCVTSDYYNPNWFDSSSLVNLENSNFGHLLPHFAVQPDMFPVLDVEPYPNSKRQKCSKDYYFPNMAPTFSNGFADFAPNPSPQPEYCPGPYTTPLFKFQHPAEVTDGGTGKTSVDNATKKVEERSVSPQSIAARERRRKITEKTQELGNLVPGGSKMNTAEMFTAAYSYVKFLQAQIGILKLMESFQEMKGAASNNELRVVVSPIVQEKLYSESKCLIPREFVEILANQCDAESKPSLSQKQSAAQI